MEEHEVGSGLPADLTLCQVARLLRLRRRTVLYAVAAGQLPRKLRGGRLVIPTAALLATFDPPAHDLGS